MKKYRLLMIFPLLMSVCFAAASPDQGNGSIGSTGLPEDIISKAKGRLSIQYRLDTAVDGDTILVTPGTYFEHINFKGKPICVKSTDGPEVTLIDGGGVGSVVLFPEGGDTTSVLDGFTVRNGGGSKDGGWLRGGGILLYDSGAKIKNCFITNNMIGNPINEKSSGGGAYFEAGTIIIKNCHFSNNQASYGGGVYAFQCAGRLLECDFFQNKAFGSSDSCGGSGSAVKIKESSEILCASNCFRFNIATRPNRYSSESRGGALYFYSCSPEINHNLFFHNEALFGGAISVISGSALTIPVIHNNIFLENSAGDEWGRGVGGAIYDWGTFGNAQALIYNNVFDGNGSYDHGGEVGIGGAVAHAGRGGDIANNIVMNTFSGWGLNVPESCDHHHNCFWNNTEGDVLNPGEGTIFVDPEVTRAGEYRLPPDSPCIDAGFDPGLGYPRLGSAYDIGAFEYYGDPPVALWYNMVSPRIAVSDSLFWKASLSGGESPVDTLLAWNYGVRDLEYSFEASAGEWLQIEGPVEGVLAPGDTVSILLHYETAGLEDGAYTDTLNLASSDPWRPFLGFPVTFNVYSHGVIRVPATMPTVQAAIDVSINGDTVLVAPGTFTGEGNRDIDFLGRAITVMSEFPHTETVIDGEGLGRGFIFETGETAGSRLKGFIIRNGYDSLRGGGIFCLESSPLILGCTINDCRADSDGGGIYSKRGSPFIGSCLVSGCSACFGGGVRVYSGELSFLNCTIVDNAAENKGGGLYSYNSNLYLSNSIVHNNSISSIEYYGETPVITFSNIESGWSGEGNIDLPPMFAGGGDYTLLEGSPCIDTGNPESPNIPWGGARRDMGAFEFDQGWYLDQNGNHIRKPEPLPISPVPSP